MKLLNKIGYKLIIAVGLTTIIIISIFAYFNIKSHSNALIEEVERHANQLSETVKHSVHYDMLLNQRERVHRIINTIGEQQAIRDVRILNKEGEIIYSSNGNDIGLMVDKNAESCYGCHAEDSPLEKLTVNERTRIFQLSPDSSKILGIINPIYNERSCYEAECHAHSKEQTVLGVLDITMSLEDVEKNIKSSEVEIILFALISIIAVSFIIGIFVNRMINKPVHELVNATYNVASGNLQYTIKETGNDELGSLARSFNNMTQKLSEARLQLFQSDKLASLGRLAAGVAHEINNPLTGVLTYSSYLLKRTEKYPDIQDDLKVIVRETKRSREIVKSLLDFARQSVPKKNLSDINEIIIRSITVLQKQLQLKSIKILKSLDSNLPKIVVDSSQMEQVFINLLVNASDAVGKNNGVIEIKTDIIKRSPLGIAQVKKAQCTKRHNLIFNEVKIDGLPSIKVKGRTKTQEGMIYLDPVYGKNRHQYEIQIQENEIVEMLCSECNYLLIKSNAECPVCKAPIYMFEIPQQGIFEGCTRKGCNWQKWDEIDKAGLKEYVEIKVKDNGCGIPKESLTKIFDPFYSTKGQKGTGLGLAVIWGIIDNHDGKITVTSEPDKGTEFNIIIPVQQ